MTNFDKIASIITDTKADVIKFEAGNKAAGTRVRKAMQDIKVLAQEIRKEVVAAKA
jgi:hypothetical protein